MRYATLTMVGPGEVEARRLAHLLRGLFRHEPSVPRLVIVDDSGGDATAAIRKTLPSTCDLVRLTNPTPPTFHHLSENTLIALRYLTESSLPEWVLKIDTDALVIGPFADRLDAFFAAHPDVGQVGRADIDVHGEPTGIGFYERMVRRYASRLQLWRSPKLAVTQAVFGRRAAWRKVVRRSLAGGLIAGTHCQGGAYALSKEALRRFKADGLLDHRTGAAVCGGSEDLMTSTLVAATGLKLASSCRPGEVFGVQPNGLPLPPEELAARGYSVIHSIKNDERFSEEAIVRHFEASG